MQRLLHTRLLVKTKPSIHFRRHLARHNLQNLLSKLDEKTVERRVHLAVDIGAVLLAIGDSSVDEVRVFGLLGGSEDERGVGRGVLGLVFGDGGKVAGVADDGLGRLEKI